MPLDLSSLRTALTGDAIARGDAGWDAARQAWNLTADQRPPLVILAATVEDVATTVRFAAANGLRVAPQSTGHGAACMGDLEETILLKTSRLTGVEVDPGRRVATVAAGAVWRDVVAPAAEHGLVGLHGMSGGVGVAGYLLGGGIGWLARRDGFASSHVASFEAVDSNGGIARVDGASDPDLFWALRGGGGRPAIVTSFEVGLLALREAFAGALMWPIERAGEIVGAYREWVTTVPDELTSTVRLIRFPPLPTVPDPLRGRALVAVGLCFTGAESEGDALVAPLRAVSEPYLDTLSMVPARALPDIAGDPTDPMRAMGAAALLDRFSVDAADAFLGLAGPDTDTPLTVLEIRHLGGALRRRDPDPGAAGPLTAEGLVYAAGAAPSLAGEETVRAALTEVGARMAPFSGERHTLLTFGEEATMRGAFAPGVAERLEVIARDRDPDGLFVANHTAA